MRFDIVSVNTLYRGIGRSLNTDDLLFEKAKVHYNESINLYFKYLDLMYNAEGVDYNASTFNECLKLYYMFKDFGIDCEMIAYDITPLTDVFGCKIELLGVDVVNDLCESLLEDANEIQDIIKKYLNSFGLLRRSEDIDVVLKNSFCGNHLWEPCMVYKINV